MAEMKRFLAAVVLALFLGCTNIDPSTTSETPFTWRGDVAQIKMVTLNGSGTCSGWMYSARILVTSGHCTEQLIRATACFYPDLEDCAKPVPLKFLGANYQTDVAVFVVTDARKPVRIRHTPLATGERVYHVGYPMGKFAVLEGLFSVHRPLERLWDAVAIPYLQHSVIAAPGSSGGPMFDSRGNLVGMIIGAERYGLGISYVRGIASPVDVIVKSVFNIFLNPPPSAPVGVIGPPTITKGPQP